MSLFIYNLFDYRSHHIIGLERERVGDGDGDGETERWITTVLQFFDCTAFYNCFWVHLLLPIFCAIFCTVTLLLFTLLCCFLLLFYVTYCFFYLLYVTGSKNEEVAGLLKNSKLETEMRR
jgi:hypothetical protein